MTFSFDPPIIAHRGASALAPENTRPAFERAKSLGVRWLEFDVMLAKCGTPIVFHDDELDRTTNQTGKVGDFTFSELRSFDAGSWFGREFAGARILSFEETLNWLVANGMSANVEIKPLPGQEEETARAVLHRLNSHATDLIGNILISSFSIPALAFCMRFSPIWARGLLLHEWLPDWQDHVNQLNGVSVHVYDEIMTSQKAAEIRQMNKHLLCYTVNHPARARELFSMGVEAVFSDLPPVMIASIFD